jgi:hypothetical protein
MIDTLKLLVQLTLEQHQRIHFIASQKDRWQWVQFNPFHSALQFRKFDGVMQADSNSFHREIRWAVPHEWKEDTCLVIEFSVPKFWYGHNVFLLYDWFNALQEFRQQLNQQLVLEGELELPAIAEWRLGRVDVCYAWKFPTQELAKGFLNSLKTIKFPWKTPTIYPDSILFRGASYSLKFYLKLPEFKSHDQKELIRRKAALEWVNYLEKQATGVLRVEATLRWLYLKRNNIVTVADLVSEKCQLFWDGEAPTTKEEEASYLSALTLYRQFERTGKEEFNPSDEESITDGMELSCPALMLEMNGKQHEIPPLKAIYRRMETTTYILQTLLTRYLGDAVMRTVDKVQTILLEHYKPAKAFRLTAFWLMVQKFGSEPAKESYGQRNYYTAKSDLKKAGISLVEPPKPAISSVVLAEFLDQFRFAVPSHNVVNPFDVDRDTPKIIRFPELPNAQ